MNLEQKEHALRGWNWGKTELARDELAFNVRNQPAFEIPYSEISNTNLAGKNEVSVEFSLPADGEETGTNGALGGARARGMKSGGALDQLVEMRFYIPGTVARKSEKEDDENPSEAEDDQNAASLFYEQLMNRAEIGEVAGDTIAIFKDVLHLTPRGRFEIDLYDKSFRLRGKTYDYKIQYESIKKFFLLPKPDDMHQLITIGLDPPLRQGQTRYPFLVMQFKRDEDIVIDLNLTEEDLAAKYQGKLLSRYEGSIATIISKIFLGLTGKKVLQPAKDFNSHHQQSGVKCSVKANEGHLFCLERAFLFVPKPATYIAFDNIAVITMSRVGGAISASRTFDITISLKGGGEHQFLNINREEQKSLESFFAIKGLKMKNEMEEEVSDASARYKHYAHADHKQGPVMLMDADLVSSDDEVVQAARGSADEDDESVDEDFQDDSESDVAEEYDSAHDSSGSDDEMADADADADSDAEQKVEPPKKKTKTSK